jgi:spore coat protein U-like protein
MSQSLFEWHTAMTRASQFAAWASRVRRQSPGRLAVAAAVALIGLAPGTAAAIGCRVTVVPFAFGNYSPGDSFPLDVTGSIDVRCQGTAGSFLATLSTGSSGSFAERHMLSGTSVMLYNFYINPARTVVWGDGTGGSLPIMRNKPRPGRQDFALPVYGRIPPSQSVGSGTYTDDIIVTIVF